MRCQSVSHVRPLLSTAIESKRSCALTRVASRLRWRQHLKAPSRGMGHGIGGSCRIDMVGGPGFEPGASRSRTVVALSSR